ncbi:hypothetical protein M9Y10_020664 [Tritrichomonas musculus]|uniref:C2 NT-type domain-containing protein n=1 Tax=Tritrichomonas musculus TaxID=1915356 RepID=A0ABR2HEB9_9EUKA
MHSLKIHLKSIKFNRNLISPNDKIRVSVTTIPEDNKAAVVIDAKQMDDIHSSFAVDITDKTKKIVLVIRKKSFFQNDPIIASTIIRSSDLPAPSNSRNTEIKSMCLFEPLQNKDSSSLVNMHYSKDRRIFGHMEILFRVESSFTAQKSSFNLAPSSSKITKRDSSLNNIENENQNDIMFIDSGI